MNKAELVAAVATETEQSQTVVAKVLESTLKNVKSTLAEGGEVKLVGFGTFSVKERAGRAGRNPKTGEALNIAASKVPSFKAGKEFRELLK
jgi:DNA-binding protein HU-beta